MSDDNRYPQAWGLGLVLLLTPAALAALGWWWMG